MGLTAEILFELGAAMPIALLTWQALRSGRTGQSGDGAVWYSGSKLLLWLTGLGLADALGIVVYFSLHEGGLAAAITRISGSRPRPPFWRPASRRA